MARIKDTDRLVRLLESEGGSLGRREITEALGFTDARYEELAGQLVAKKVVARNRGRTGGLRLASIELSTDDREAPLERDAYPGFGKYLLDAAAANDVARSVILETHRTHKGKWETPDLAEVRVTPYPMVGQWELLLLAYELKRQDGWGVESVLQAATYKEFANESWLVIPPPPDEDVDWTEHFTKRVVDRARDLGVGLATFDTESNILRTHTSAERRAVSSLQRQQEWLERVILSLGVDKKRSEISANIRWARSKAESGRD